MPQKTHTFAGQTLDAAQVLGAQIAQARRERGWTMQELAQRVGVSQRTISNLEHGSPTVTMGIAFEAATLLGIRLFGVEGLELSRLARQGQQMVALLPSRVRPSKDAVRDDF